MAVACMSGSRALARADSYGTSEVSEHRNGSRAATDEEFIQRDGNGNSMEH